MQTRQATNQICSRVMPVALIMLLFLLSMTGSAAAASTTIYATQDTYVRSTMPGMNYAGDILYSGSGLNLLAQFDISSIPAGATINSATLKLYVADITGDIPPAKDFRATEINAPWSDAAVTWASNPPSGTTGPVIAISGTGDYAWDVTSMVTGWHSGTPNHGIKVVPETSGTPDYSIVVHSLESDAAKAPRLIIDYSEQGDNDNVFSDLGDAPDSSNHHGVANTAYPAIGVNGRFPTVYDSPISGPLHADARPARLGNFATGEVEADIGADLDGVNNIMTGGVDRANEDLGDNGWLNPNVPIINCQRSSLQVRVSKHNSLPTPNRMYLNVYFDGNRDGDWRDTTQCPPDPAGVVRPGYEWMVQNFVVDMTVIPAGGFNDIVVNSVYALNAAPDKAHWMRFTLSEMPTSGYIPDGAGLPDGRGPQKPGHFLLGETEDYVQVPDPQGQPGQIELHKGIDGSAAGGVIVQPGDVFTWTIRAEHVGGTANAATTISDTLPAGVVLAGTPSVSEEAPTVGPLSAAISGRTVTWTGGMTPGGKVRIDIPVRALNCFGANDRSITNKVTGIQTDGSPIETTSTVVVDCIDLALGHLDLHASLFDRQPLESRAGDRSVGFGRIGLRIQMRNDNPSPLAFDLDIKSGLLSLDQTTLNWTGCLTCIRGTEDRAINTVPRNTDGESEMWSVSLAPGEIRTFEAIYELSEDVDDGTELPFDISACRGTQGLCGNFDDDSNERLELAPIVWQYKKRDLGDAPDSSNHPAAPMSAYTGVPANFPTVFDPATGFPSGPSHVRPRPFHLGQRVSHEIEADIGPDQDPSNNIDPVANIADRDRFDDGVRPDLWTLNNCQPTTIDVQVYIHPTALAWFNNNDQTHGYLNVWLDSNRDGDWADWGQCPNDPQYQFNEATEHIVINQAINVAGLGAGLHTVTVGTQRVLWPVDTANDPVWTRVTLATRAAPLPHSTGNGTAYGDGRSDGNSYMMGETEDYLRYADQGVADVGVKKEGRIRTEVDAEGNIVARIGWSIKYANNSSSVANNVVVKDTLQAGQSVINIVASNPAILPPTAAGNMLTFNIGTLLPGESGTIFIETEIVGAEAGLQIGNLVEISAENDSDSSNNSDTAVVVLELYPPVITNPLPGTMCDNVVHIDGVSMPGTTVDVYVDGVLLGNYPTDSAGNWGVTTTVADGTHSVYAVAKIGAATSAPSPTTTFIVDSSLIYSPMSLAFTDMSNGMTVYPADSSGRHDGVDPQLQLRAHRDYSVTLKLCCDDENATVEMDISGVGTVSMTDPDGDDVYEGTFTTGDPASLVSPVVTISIICNGTEFIIKGGIVLIDPAGVVYDATDGALQEDAVVTLSEDVGGSFIEWPAAAFGQVNPQTTLSDGWFSFFTPAGTYRLNVVKDGYQPYVSTDIEVVDQLVIYNVPLMPEVTEEADYVIYIDEDGFDQTSIELVIGDVVEFVNLTLDGGTATSNSPVLSPATRNSDGFDSGLLDAGESHKVVFTSAGTFEYVDNTDRANLALITVSASAPTAVALSGAATGLSSTSMLVSLLAVALGGTFVIMRQRQLQTDK